MKILYAGSFNPFHFGHKYVFDLASRFGSVWIGVGQNKAKPTTANMERLLKPITNKVLNYEGLTAGIVKQHGFDLLVRGVRPGRSLEYEEELLYWNRKLSGCDTVLIPTPPEINQISSSAIRELDSHGVGVSEYMPLEVFARWKNKVPLKTVFFGRSCCGKTTFAKDALNADKKIWDFVANSATTKQQIKNAFYEKDRNAFDELVRQIGLSVDWHRLFDVAEVHDMPVIGLYWEYIPSEIKGALHLVRLTTSEENRQRFIATRKCTDNFIECADFFYEDPPYWDEERRIEYV